MAITEQQRIETVMAMVCAETSCNRGELTDGQVHIVEKRLGDRALPDHRRAFAHPGNMCVVTFGTGAVVATAADHIDWARKTYSGLDRDGVFDPIRLGEAARYWSQFNQRLFGPFPRFSGSSETVRVVEAPAGYAVSIAGPEVYQLMDAASWPNSYPSSHPSRPLMFAAAARPDGRDELAGVAAVTRDSDFLWQIGIDVAAAHRGKGVGNAIASAAALEAIARDKVPYWGATNSNVPSIRTALAIGLTHTYTEVLTRPMS